MNQINKDQILFLERQSMSMNILNQVANLIDTQIINQIKNEIENQTWSQVGIQVKNTVWYQSWLRTNTIWYQSSQNYESDQ